MMVAVFIIVGQKVIAVAHGLHHDKRAVEHQRSNRHKNQLGIVIGGAGRAGGEIGQHQREHQNRHQHNQRGVGRFFAEKLLAVFPAANQQAQAQNAVENQHNRRKNGVAGNIGGILAAGHHQRNNQRHFDNGDGHRQNNRAERFAHFVCHHFGVIHRREHAAGQQYCRHRLEPAAARYADKIKPPSQKRQNKRPQGQREGFFLCHRCVFPD